MIVMKPVTTSPITHAVSKPRLVAVIVPRPADPQPSAPRPQ